MVWLERISERVDGSDYRSYTIHKILKDGVVDCYNCGEFINAGDLAIPYKDREGLLGEVDELYYYCWHCFPIHPRAKENID